MSRDFVLVCFVYKIGCAQINMGRKGKELSVEVKEIAQKLLEEGKTIRHMAEVLSIPTSTIWSLKKRIKQRGPKKINLEVVENLK